MKVIEVVHILRGAAKMVKNRLVFLSVTTNFLEKRENLKVRIKRIVVLLL